MYARADTACYDPVSKCIWLPSVSSDGGAVLEGSIIEMDAPPTSPLGKLLLGEILEIVILDENMNPMEEVYGEEPPSSTSHRRQRHDERTSETATLAHHSLTREELLQRQREQQQFHYQQSQDLLQKHQKEKQHLDSLEWEGKLSSDDKLEFSADMEDTHRRELMELQNTHQREQSEMANLISESASSVSGRGNGDANDVIASVASRGSRDVTIVLQKPQNVSDMWNRAAVATVSAGAMNQNSVDEKEQSQPTNEVQSENKTAGLWNRAAVATVAAGTMNQISTEEREQSQSMDEFQSEIKTAGLWNGAAVATVATGTMNQIATDEKEQSQTAHEFHPENKFVGLWNRAAVATVAAGTMNQNSTADGTPLINNTTSHKNLEEQKKEELRAVMRDRHLPKEERIKKMSAVRQKYSELESASPETSQPSLQLESKSMEELRRGEIQAVMKDRTLSREVKQARLAEIKAKYAKEPPPSGNTWEAERKGVVAANTMSQGRKQPNEQRRDANRSSAKLWKQATVSTATTNAFAESFTAMKQIQGKTTPMSEFVRQLKSNDPSLATIMLDERKSSSDEWSDLFNALEGNSSLTHLSLAGCGLTDDTAVPLVLALVENETLTSLNLSRNRDLTNGTGKSLVKVLKQSNAVLKTVNIGGTKITPKILEKIMDILADRDDTLKLAKVQAARQKKISELLAFSASDEITPSSQRLSQRLLQMDSDSEDDTVDKTRGTKSGSFSGKGKNKNGKKKRRASAESKGDSSRGSSKHSGGSAGSPVKGSGDRRSSSAGGSITGISVTSSTASGRRRSSAGGSITGTSFAGSTANGRRKLSGGSITGTSITGSAANGRRKSSGGSITGTFAGDSSAAKANFRRAARTSMAARDMAMLGGDITSGTGKTAEEVREARKLRGECQDCGQKCFRMTMFKTIPLDISDKVKEGRCLQCT